MFSLKLNLLFASLKDAKDLARKFNRPVHPHMNPRELKRMQEELRTAREHARLMNVFNRNRIY
jgi:hypothetical protein